MNKQHAKKQTYLLKKQYRELLLTACGLPFRSRWYLIKILFFKDYNKLIPKQKKGL